MLSKGTKRLEQTGQDSYLKKRAQLHSFLFKREGTILQASSVLLRISRLLRMGNWANWGFCRNSEKDNTYTAMWNYRSDLVSNEVHQLL